MQEVDPDVADIIKEEGGEVLELCYQCGMCTGTCPWNMVSSFLSRRLIHKAQLGVVDFEDKAAWKCVSCRLCVQVCPRGVEIPDIMRALRRVIVGVGAGKTPDSLRISGKNLSGVGNPLGEPPEKRTDWAKDLNVKTFIPGTELLYLACCYQSYDSRCRRVARATVDVLQKAGVDFGILDNEQNCCGESIRKAGHESAFQSLAQKNIELFNAVGAKKVLVSSPHCYYTLKAEYGELGSNIEVVHPTQFFAGLINEGRLKFTREFRKKVTYHDSCYLGRAWDDEGIYDEPRKILESIPGVELVEMRENRKFAICCGGGGGGMWQDVKKGERLADLRVDQALATEAQVLAVACPYCMVMFEDSVLSSNKSDALEVKDIAEIIQEAL
ncbi:(Fe-S)-binding protein [Chloroflexota bacterium]